jgi:DNA repair exonuclease SbcCD ATPase subunit
MTKKTTLNELGSMLTHVVKHMATKDDVAALRKELKGDIAEVRKEIVTKDDLSEELAPIRSELKAIRRDLDDLREKVENVSGFQKEIDHALERIAAIEKHLGLDKKIAA